MNNTVAEPEISEVIELKSPGKMLSNARNKLGYSQQYVADQLHLRVKSVVAIEQDQLEENVSLTFSKGYVRLYAKLVSLDENTVLDAFNLLHKNGETPTSMKMQSFSRRVEREAHDSRWTLVSYVILFFVFASLGYWWYDNHGNGDIELLSDQAATPNATAFAGNGEDAAQVSTASENNETVNLEDSSAEQASNSVAMTDSDLSQNENLIASNVVEEVSETSSGALTSDQESTSTVDSQQDDLAEDESVSNSSTSTLFAAQASTSSVPDLVNDKSVTSQQLGADDETSNVSVGETVDSTSIETPVSTANQSNEPTGSANAVDMTFTFNDDCWLSVTDATDDAIAYGIKAKGYVMNISGVPPISINLCPPERVSIIYDGSPVNLSRFEPENSTVLTLPLN